MESGNLTRLIFKTFKARGLTVSGNATKALVSVLSRYGFFLMQEFIHKVDLHGCVVLLCSEADIEGSLRLILDELKLRVDNQDGNMKNS